METLVRRHRMELDRLRKATKRQRAKKQAQAIPSGPTVAYPLSIQPAIHAAIANVESRPETPTPTHSVFNESFNASQVSTPLKCFSTVFRDFRSALVLFTTLRTSIEATFFF